MRLVLLFVLSFYTLTQSGANAASSTECKAHPVTENNEVVPMSNCVDQALTDAKSVKVCIETKVSIVADDKRDQPDKGKYGFTEECTKITVDGSTLLDLPCIRTDVAFRGAFLKQNTIAKCGSGPAQKTYTDCLSEKVAASAKRTLLSIDKQTNPECKENNCQVEGTIDTYDGKDDAPTSETCKDHKGVATDKFCATANNQKEVKTTDVTYNGNKIVTATKCVKINEYFVQNLQKGPGGDKYNLRTAKMNDKVRIHYRGVNKVNGEEIDNSYYNNKPVNVELGTEQFMKGWDKAIPGMRVGDVRKVTIPRRWNDEVYTYPKGSPTPYAKDDDTLIFEIKLMEICPCKKEEL